MSLKANLHVAGAVSAACGLLFIPLSTAAAAPSDSHVKMPKVIHGRLAVNSAGSSGQYRVVAWPTSSALAKLPVGGSVPTKIVAEGDVPRGGAFDISLGSLPAGPEYQDSNGSVNVEVLITDGTRQSDWYSPVGVDGKLHIDAEHATSDVTFDLGTGFVARGGISAASSGAVKTPVAVGKKISKAWVRRDPGKGIHMAVDTCHDVASTKFPNLRERVALVYGWGGASATVATSAGAKHTMGVEVSGRGGWSMSGRTELSASGGASIDHVVDKAVHNRVNYQEFRNTCGWARRQAVSFYAFLPAGDDIPTKHVDYAWCAPYSIGQGNPWKTTGTNLEFGNGVNLGGVLLTSQVGWNAETKIQFRFSRNSYLCGENADGPASSRNQSAKRR